MVKAFLTCGGSGGLEFTRLPAGSDGGLRIRAQLANDSGIHGEIITPDPGCWLHGGTATVLRFGVTYWGLQGQESPTDPTPCIVQSAADFSQIYFENGVFNPGIPKAREQIHQAFDDVVIGMLFGSTGKPSRCSRWKEQFCGDSIIEGLETCDDGNIVRGDGCNGTCSGPP